MASRLGAAIQHPTGVSRKVGPDACNVEAPTITVIVPSGSFSYS